MNVDEFLEEIFKAKANFYEIVLVKNINLQQIKINNESEMFLMEIYQMQNAYNIYIIPKLDRNHTNNHLSN